MSYLLESTAISATSWLVNIINVPLCVIVECLASYVRHDSINEESLSKFKKILIVQFINLAILILLVNFEFHPDKDSSMPFMNGVYNDFSIEWY